MDETTRGSRKMMLQRCIKQEIGEAELKQFVELVDLEGVKLLDVFCYGIPNPDAIKGTLHVDKEVFDKLSNRILDLRDLRLRKIDVFPYGIPVIDLLRVELEVGPGY